MAAVSKKSILDRTERFILRPRPWVKITQPIEPLPVQMLLLNPRHTVVAFKMKEKKEEFKQRRERDAERLHQARESKF